MIRKILKFIRSEIKDAFSWKTWLLFYIPAMLIGMAVFVHDKILFSPPPPPRITYTPPKWDLLEKWLEQQKEKFNNLKREKQG